MRASESPVRNTNPALRPLPWRARPFHPSTRTAHATTRRANPILPRLRRPRARLPRPPARVRRVPPGRRAAPRDLLRRLLRGALGAAQRRVSVLCQSEQERVAAGEGARRARAVRPRQTSLIPSLPPPSLLGSPTASPRSPSLPSSASVPRMGVGSPPSARPGGPLGSPPSRHGGFASSPPARSPAFGGLARGPSGSFGPPGWAGGGGTPQQSVALGGPRRDWVAYGTASPAAAGLR